MDAVDAVLLAFLARELVFRCSRSASSCDRIASGTVSISEIAGNELDRRREAR